MARQLREDTTFDEIEDEIRYTRAALRADPDASDLLALTDGWMALVDAARAKDRAAREAIADATAGRIVANGRLDDECKAFGDELHLAVSKDHGAARWKRFFPSTVTAFVRQRLASQVAGVRGWLGVQGDDVLDRHRTALERWGTAAAAAIDVTQASGQVRGDAHVARETLVADLTRERDGLEAQLVQRAHERHIAREWPSRFFPVLSRHDDAQPPVVVTHPDGPPSAPRAGADRQSQRS